MRACNESLRKERLQVEKLQAELAEIALVLRHDRDSDSRSGESARAMVLALGRLAAVLGNLEEVLGVQRALADEALDRTRRVLVVDDSESCRVIVSHVLAQAGYEVDVSVDAADAWSRLHQHRFDALVSDIEMPGEDGDELVRRVRASRRFPELRVILNSAIDVQLGKSLAIACGADAWVAKHKTGALATLLEHVDRLTARAE